MIKFRAKKKTEENIEKLKEIVGTTNTSEIVERSVMALVLLSEYDPKLFSQILIESTLYSIKVNGVKVLDSSIVKENDFHSVKLEKIQFESRKPNESEESYQQTYLHPRVEDVMPYGSEFKVAWMSWKNYLRDAFNFFPPKATELAQLKKLNDLQDEQRSIEIINESITNGWRKLVTEDKRGKQGTSFSADKAKAIIDEKFRADNS